MHTTDWPAYFESRMNFLWSLRFEPHKAVPCAERLLIVTGSGFQSAGRLASATADATPRDLLYEVYVCRLFQRILRMSDNALERQAMLLASGHFGLAETLDLDLLGSNLSLDAHEALQEAVEDLYGV